MRTPTGEIRLDPSGRAAGRGAYICTDEACWPTAIGRGALAAQLRVTIPDETIDELADQMTAARERLLLPTMGG